MLLLSITNRWFFPDLSRTRAESILLEEVGSMAGILYCVIVVLL